MLWLLRIKVALNLMMFLLGQLFVSFLLMKPSPDGKPLHDEFVLLVVSMSCNCPNSCQRAVNHATEAFLIKLAPFVSIDL